MPATAATPVGAFDEFVEASKEYELIGLAPVLTEYRSRIVSTVSGNTYWRELATDVPSVLDARPASMFRTPGFSVVENGSYDRVHFRVLDDPDELDW